MSKAVGLALYFLGLGLWVIVFVLGVLWVLPWIALFYLAGWLSHARPWPQLRDYSVWRWLRNDYFHFRTVGATLPSPENGEEPVIYAIYPHGHFSITALIYFALNPRFGSARPAIHSAIFWIPVFGTLAMWIEAIGVTHAEMSATLRSGKSIYMCPGGVADIANTGTQIQRREGFIHVARDCGARVVPIWCPQERSYYSHWLPLGRWLQPLLGFPVPLFIWGLWWCPFLPRGADDSPIRVGKAVDSAEEFWAEMERLQNFKVN